VISAERGKSQRWRRRRLEDAGGSGGHGRSDSLEMSGWQKRKKGKVLNHSVSYEKALSALMQKI